MKRSKELVEKRKDFVIDYVRRNQDKQMKVIVTELTEMLFLSERTIYNILLRPNIQIKFSLSV
jgi:MarR-like DNA-binding transcriptional regulator SgrR of sgrS sRNA